MKAEAQIETEPQRLTVRLTLEKIEDVGPALDALKDMALVVWPNAVIEDEKITDHVKVRRRPAGPVGGAAIDYAKPPNPDKLDGRVMKAARDLGRIDRVAIADDLDLSTVMVAQAIGRLRKGGHLEGLK